MNAREQKSRISLIRFLRELDLSYLGPIPFEEPRACKTPFWTEIFHILGPICMIQTLFLGSKSRRIERNMVCRVLTTRVNQLADPSRVPMGAIKTSQRYLWSSMLTFTVFWLEYAY